MMRTKCYYLLLALLLSSCDGGIFSNSVKKNQVDAAIIGENTPIYADNGKVSTNNAAKKLVVEKNLWQYISSRHSLPGYGNTKLQSHIKWFKKNPIYLTKVSNRAKPYLYLAVEEVRKANLPMEIALLPIIESNYYPFSYSHGHASGLWQFIASTGKIYNLKQNWWYDGRRDVLASTKAAVAYLKYLNNFFAGDWLLALAAYNAGPGRVQRAVAKNKKLGKKTDFWSLDLPRETRNYIPKLLAVATIIKNQKLYGQNITPIINEPKLHVVELKSQFDLAVVAKWTQLPLEDIYLLNPGIKRWATPPNSIYNMLLPIDKADIFREKLASSPNIYKISWLRHKIKSGENLGYLATKFKTTVAAIKNINRLNNDVIITGDYLILPMAQKDDSYYSLSEGQRGKRKRSVTKNSVKIVYTVKAGDSLWRIAKKHDTYVDNIVKWNNISRSKLLQINEKLVIWMVKGKAKITNASNAVNIKQKINYVVKKGDNLSAIANKFKVSLSKLQVWNKINFNKLLQPGQKLQIIIDVVNSKAI